MIENKVINNEKNKKLNLNKVNEIINTNYIPQIYQKR